MRRSRPIQLAFIDMFHAFYRNNDPLSARGPVPAPRRPLPGAEPARALSHPGRAGRGLRLPFQRAQHPYYEQQGPVKALETIRFAISTHRGCYGECNYCAIAVHEGRTVRWRSPEFDPRRGGDAHPPARFQGLHPGCGRSDRQHVRLRVPQEAHAAAPATTGAACIPRSARRCKPDHQPQIELLRRLRRLPGVKKVFVASGIRYDLLLADRAHGKAYLQGDRRSPRLRAVEGGARAHRRSRPGAHGQARPGRACCKLQAPVRRAVARGAQRRST